MWDSPPDIVLQFREQLKLCPTIITLGALDSRFNYPNSDLSPDAVFPQYMLAEPDNQRDRYAEGAVGLVSGALVCTLYLSAAQAATAGAAEKLARTIVKELWGQFYGIAWKSTQVGLASDPLPAQRAPGSDEDDPQTSLRTITITVYYGLSR